MSLVEEALRERENELPAMVLLMSKLFLTKTDTGLCETRDSQELYDWFTSAVC